MVREAKLIVSLRCRSILLLLILLVDDALLAVLILLVLPRFHPCWVFQPCWYQLGTNIFQDFIVKFLNIQYNCFIIGRQQQYSALKLFVGAIIFFFFIEILNLSQWGEIDGGRADVWSGGRQ